MTIPEISVIIPTYNRRDWLSDILDSLAEQTVPLDEFEVIVVDDGSQDGTGAIIDKEFPFRFRYVYQINQGDAKARNAGARLSQANLLVFLDDDMVVAPDYLHFLRADARDHPQRIVVGTEHTWLEDANPLKVLPPEKLVSLADQERANIHFSKVYSNNMCIWREAYWDIGPMESLGFSGSSMWCDVEFAYRAHLLDYEFVRSTHALCFHRNYVYLNLDNHSRRMEEAAFRAAAMFQKHADLVSYLPMFDDKTPVDLNEDPPRIVVRKLVRRVASTRPMLWILEQIIGLVTGARSSSRMIVPLQRWLVGGYIFRGYRKGLQQLQRAGKLSHG